jgi:hypothetical protein
MTTLIKGQDIRTVTLGISVSRAAALLPATAYGALFTVSVGKVLVSSLVGEVVVVMPATTNTTKITGTPTAGTAVDWTSAVSTASAEVGTVITPAVTAGGALIVANAGAGNIIPDAGRVAQIGTIGVTTSGTAATGTVKWTLTYVPLDPGATVVAA